MKKLLTGGGLVLASLAYVLFQHFGNSGDAPVLDIVPQPQSAPSAPVVPTPPISNVPTPVKTPPAAPAPVPTPKPTPAPAVGMYRDGSYTGSVANAYYGYVQVKAIISGGALTALQILQYPNDRSTSRFINGQALPALEQEAIRAQTANVDTVSGASDTSGAFRQSLGAALVQAKT